MSHGRCGTRRCAALRRAENGLRHTRTEVIMLVKHETEASCGRLTPRQWDVLCLLCEGMPNKLISRNLNIATATVKIHVAGVLRELGVSNRLQAVVAAQRLGLDRPSTLEGRKAA